jgi:hypothetical protein
MSTLREDQLQEPLLAAYYAIFLAASGEKGKARDYLEPARQTQLQLPEEKTLLDRAEAGSKWRASGTASGPEGSMIPPDRGFRHGESGFRRGLAFSRLRQGYGEPVRGQSAIHLSKLTLVATRMRPVKTKTPNARSSRKLRHFSPILREQKGTTSGLLL